MKTYLVGGAIRDELLGLAVEERDWVVVGATPQELLDLGYRQVGNSFPVFLHPQTNEEYALARTERKTGAGYGGFAFDFNPQVTLEEDLQRRDITINAIARSESGQLVDPYGGLADIKARQLRHVSEAFSEDPLRVLRVARFHARLHHLGFRIHPQTLQLMKTLSAGDELLALSPERVWLELQKGLATAAPDIFIDTLYHCGALGKLIPELEQRFLHRDNLRDSAEQVGRRILQALRYLATKIPLSQRASASAESSATHTLRRQAGWAICCHALDDNTSPKNLVPKGVIQLEANKSSVYRLCQRLATPAEFRRVAVLAAAYIHIVIQARHCSPQTIVDLLGACDAWRKPEQFQVLLLVAESLISTSPQGQGNIDSIELLRLAHKDCLGIRAKSFIKQGLSGEAVGDAIRKARKVAVAELKKQFL